MIVYLYVNRLTVLIITNCRPICTLTHFYHLSFRSLQNYPTFRNSLPQIACWIRPWSNIGLYGELVEKHSIIRFLYKLLVFVDYVSE